MFHVIIRCIGNWGYEFDSLIHRWSNPRKGICHKPNMAAGIKNFTGAGVVGNQKNIQQYYAF
jgi:hypothetical protein